MNQNESYTIEEIAQILKVSKLTVYDLIKKGKIPAYRVGRQMRVDAADLEAYKNQAKSKNAPIHEKVQSLPTSNDSSSQTYNQRPIIISGQDTSLDILAKHIEKRTNQYRPLRSYVGSLDSLISMYKGEADIVSTHLLDGDTAEYNLSYVRKILVNHSFILIHLISRQAGFYVKKGNPKNIESWEDLKRSNVKLINREIGSGARTLLDEQLRVNGLKKESINGYHQVETSHLGIAGMVAKGEADVGIGIEKAAQFVGIDFIPLITERYDLVILKTEQNKELLALMTEILQSPEFKEELTAIGYDTSLTGRILYEQ